ncbi:GAF domain-containing sensor histidine kinase [Sinomonas halotolerans]|uniref:GAF domain-containing protein n=1 Tax=Sinomonas halotolerans TaxID=1644133 RepID=A0ABU9X337_9MICC
MDVHETGGGSILPETAANRIEDLLKQFVSRAHELLETQERMRGLLSAVVSVAEELTLEAVLDRVVTSARDLVGARYAALGVLAPEGGLLSHFLTVGMDDETVSRIGAPPTGHGVLGLLIREPHPIRLHDLGAHADSYGFPANHPPMHSFLGVPIRVRDEVFGNLYLTEKAGGEDFSAEDEDLAVALAAAAGVAIENARLFADIARRQRWREASMGVAGGILEMDEPEDAFELIAEQALVLSESDLAAVALPWHDGEQVRWPAVVGAAAEEFDAVARAGAVALAARAVAGGHPILAEGAEVFGGAHRGIRQVLVVPGSQGIGAVVLARAQGGPPISPVDVEMAPGFFAYTALALQVARTHLLREQLVVFSDRDRIARDLHDIVIQRLFAAGLSLQGLRRFIPHGAGEKIDAITAELDESIAAVRSTIYSLNEASATDRLSARLVRVVQDGARSLPSAPRVELYGPIDTAVSPAVGDHVVAVLTEGVSNVVRHAQADSLWVTASVSGGRLELVVSDDGQGLGEVTRRSGLKNVEDRARVLGGTCEVGSSDDGGTRLRWEVPLGGR